MSLKEVQVGDTRNFTWVDSGVTPTIIWHAIFDKDETLVWSATGTSSGNGHYYDLARVNTIGLYTSHWGATIGGLPYIRREKFKAVLIEV